MIYLSNQIKEKLKTNWDARALNRQCHAEACIAAESGTPTYWVLAMNPEDEDEIIVLGNGFEREPFVINFRDTVQEFASLGHPLILDHEFKRGSADEIYKRLRGRR